MNDTVKKSIVTLAVMVLLGCLVVGVLLGSAAYGWKAAQRAGNEAATLHNMKTIAAVEIQYYNTHEKRFGTFAQLIKEQLLTSKFSGDPLVCDDYVFTLMVTPTHAEQPGSYTLNVDPQSGDTVRRHFYIDSSSGSIHVNSDRSAGANDPALGE
jgi:Na+-transporting NADH:ubiquinone oxidoreductase subunit NqrC